MESADALPTVISDEEAAEDVLLTAEAADELSDDVLAVSVTKPDCTDEPLANVDDPDVDVSVTPPDRADKSTDDVDEPDADAESETALLFVSSVKPVDVEFPSPDSSSEAALPSDPLPAEYAVFDAVVPDVLPEELVVLVLAVLVLELAADVSSPADTLTLSIVPLYGAVIWHVFTSSVISVSSSVSSLRSERSSFSVVVSDTPVR